MGNMVFAQSAFDFYEKAHYALAEGNYNDAFTNFKRSADMGFGAAMYDLAICYEYGEGTSINYELARQYLYKAATGKDPWSPAFTALGRFYLLGIGVDKNPKEAISWWEKGAETFPNDKNLKGGAECMYNLGLIYNNGDDVPQDIKKAVYWYQKAANLGLPIAAQGLGKRYLLGEGVEQNSVEAVKWFRIAAEADVQECALSQFIIGMCYLDGTGNVPIDKKEALMWLKKAATKGFTDANIKIVELEGK